MTPILTAALSSSQGEGENNNNNSNSDKANISMTLNVPQALLEVFFRNVTMYVNVILKSGVFS